MSGMRVLITCPQLQRTFDEHRSIFEREGIDVLLPPVVQQLSEGELMEVLPGVDGIIVSNHGARSEDSGRATIDALPEIIDAVRGRMPVLVDSGFRRGTDIAKALCMGATAVAVGRPYIWGLGAFGQPGVEKVLEILRTELRAIMQQVGAPTIKHLVPSMVRRA